MHVQASLIRSFTNRAAAVFGVALLLAGTVTPLVTTHAAGAEAVPQNVAKISFTFDDGLESAYTDAQPTLAKYGLTGTDYVITGCADQVTNVNGQVVPCASDPSGTYMSWTQVQKLQADGWEIGSHTVDHGCMASDATIDPDDCSNPAALTEAQLETELGGSQQDLATHGINATDFAWPYGDYGNLSLAVAAKYYASTRGFADDDANNVYPYNDLVLHDQQFQAGAPTRTWAICPVMTVAGAESCINTAVTAGQWVVLVFHNITPIPNTTADSYDEATGDLDQIAAYAAQEQTAGLAKVVNIKDGLATGANLFANGDFQAGIADGWTTDDPTNITADANNNGRYPEPTHSVSLKGSADGATNGHLFSPEVPVTAGQTYALKNFVNITGGTSVTNADGTITDPSINFYIDEYAADGTTKLTGIDPGAGIKYTDCALTTKCIDVADVDFTYTPSAGAAYAQLQVIIKGANTTAYYDGAQFFVPGSTTTTLIGDVNSDGKVNGLDISTILGNWYTGTPSATPLVGDANGDGQVDGLDISTILGNWRN